MPLRDRFSERQLRVLTALSQLGNVLLWDGQPDTTMSYVVAQNRHDPRYRRWVWILEALDRGHLDWAQSTDAQASSSSPLPR